MDGASDSLPIERRRIRFPPELINEIIALLLPDRATLATCALVCRSWIRASRRHLFSLLKIDYDCSSDRLKVLSSTNCTISPAVKHFVLMCYRGSDCGASSIREITSRMPNVTWFSLWDWQFFNISPLPFVSILGNLEILELAYCSFAPKDASLSSLLRHTPQLRVLCFDRVHIWTPDEMPTQWVPQILPTIDEAGLGLQLKMLSLRGSDRIIPWLVERWKSGAPGLVALSLSDMTENFGDSLLEAVGSSLQMLHIVVYPRPPSMQRFPLLTQLRSLSYELNDVYANGQDGLQWLIQAMRSLSSPHFQELTIVSSIRNWRPSDEWTTLGSIIESPRFLPTVRALNIYCLVHLVKSESENRKKWLEGKFPLCAAQGILHVKSGSPPSFMQWRP